MTILRATLVVAATVLFSPALAGAQTLEASTGTRGKGSVAQPLLRKLFADPACQFVGLAYANHTSTFAMRELISFIETSALSDPKFRLLLMEGPANTQRLTVAASKGDISIDTFKDRLEPDDRRLFTEQPQASTYLKVLKALQTVNQNRPEAPILLLCVDGMTSEKIKQGMAQLKLGKPPRYGSSINREKDTATNVVSVLDRYKTSRVDLLSLWTSPEKHQANRQRT